MKKLSLLFIAMFALFSVNLRAQVPATGDKGYLYDASAKRFVNVKAKASAVGLLFETKNDGTSEGGFSGSGTNWTDPQGRNFTYVRFYNSPANKAYALSVVNQEKITCDEDPGYSKLCVRFEEGKGLLIYCTYALRSYCKQGQCLSYDAKYNLQFVDEAEATYWQLVSETDYPTLEAAAIAAHKDELAASAPTGKMSVSVASALATAKTTLASDATAVNYVALEDAIDNAEASVAAYAAVKAALDEGAATEFPAKGKTYYNETVASVVTAYENGTIEGDGAAEVKVVKDAISAAKAMDIKPGDDVTSLIANPQFNDGVSGWSGDFGNGKQKGDASNYVVTNYGKASDIYQELNGLKKGYYKLEVQAFTRLQTSDRSIADGGWDWHYVLNGEELANYASIYANGVEKKVHSIIDKVYEAKGSGTWATIEGTSPELYVPYNANSSSDVFTRGDYDNYLYCYVGDDGKLTLGVKNTDTSSSAYIAYDNFRLTFIGEELPTEDVILEVTDAKYATFVAPFDVTIPAGVEAYTVDAVKADGATLDLKQVDNVIAANTPVVLYAETPVSTTVSGANVATDLVCKAGLLTGVYCEKYIPVKTGYVLQKQGEDVKFFQTAEMMKVPANRAYLFIPADSGIEAKAFGFDAIATAIQNMKVAEAAKSGAIYNLAGQQLNGLQKGVNIVGGKKVLVK